MGEFTKLMKALEDGDTSASDDLMRLVYDELRRLATAQLAHEKPGQTLQPTALVHEAFLRLAGDKGLAGWKGRAHFFTAASVAIRRVLIDQARKKRSLKRGGEYIKCELDDIPSKFEPSEDLLALDEALNKLAAVHPKEAELVQLLYFAGLTLPEAAESIGVSPRTAGRLWSFARAWLRREIDADEPASNKN